MKFYIKPKCEIINILHSNILASSYSYSYSNSSNNELRMKYMIEAGANITEYPIRKTDIFVYEKQYINNQIIKKTPNNPEIGMVIQLDYHERIKIFKHLSDNGYDYWYCKYLPNNGRDVKVTY